MSHWIKVSNNNLCVFIFHSFFIKLDPHSYGSLVFSQTCVDMSYVCGLLSLQF